MRSIFGVGLRLRVRTEAVVGTEGARARRSISLMTLVLGAATPIESFGGVPAP